MSREVARWGDTQQYISPPINSSVPRVHLLQATTDPLGSIAAMAGIYEGRVFKTLTTVTDADRYRYFEDMRHTELNTPFESVIFHFLLEGVDRSFTHQLVRTRMARYAQESLRFAVVEELAERVPFPPALAKETEANRGLRAVWAHAVSDLEHAYEALVDNGVPAEEARGLLPHAVQTRIHFVVDYRTLIKMAGERLCTQAQFHWRIVFAQIANAIQHYHFSPQWLHVPVESAENYADFEDAVDVRPDAVLTPAQQRGDFTDATPVARQGWLLTLPFHPVCYQKGHCPFKAGFDRACTIRPRVDMMAAKGVPSWKWREGAEGIDGIRPEEWLLNPSAARKK